MLICADLTAATNLNTAKAFGESHWTETRYFEVPNGEFTDFHLYDHDFGNPAYYTEAHSATMGIKGAGFSLDGPEVDLCDSAIESALLRFPSTTNLYGNTPQPLRLPLPMAVLWLQLDPLAQ